MSNDKVFSMIFDGIHDEHDDRSRRPRRRDQRGVIMPPAMRKRSSGHRKSRYYTRPVFKEPGSKLGEKAILETEDEADFEATNQSNHRLAIVHELRDEVGKILASEGGADAIQPSSRTQTRLKSLVGMPSSRFGHHGTRSSNHGLPNTGRQQRASHSTPESLETRILQSEYALEKQPSDLSAIRREVNKLVYTVMPRHTESLSGRENRPLSNEVEGRDEASENRNQDGDEASTDGHSLNSVTSMGLMSIWSEAPSLSTMVSDMSTWRWF